MVCRKRRKVPLLMLFHQFSNSYVFEALLRYNTACDSVLNFYPTDYNKIANWRMKQENGSLNSSDKVPIYNFVLNQNSHEQLFLYLRSIVFTSFWRNRTATAPLVLRILRCFMEKTVFNFSQLTHQKSKKKRWDNSKEIEKSSKKKRYQEERKRKKPKKSLSKISIISRKLTEERLVFF